MRRYVALAVAVACLLSLTACYFGPWPSPVQYAALEMVDGKPTAVVVTCGLPGVIVRLYAVDGDVFETWQVAVAVPDAAPLVEVELLGQPRPGWVITERSSPLGTGTDATTVAHLTSFVSGEEYTVDSSEGGPEGATAPAPAFTTDDLTGIGDGQVLQAHKKLTSRDDFVEQTAKNCGGKFGPATPYRVPVTTPSASTSAASTPR
jgi:hypothetical protein